LAALSCQPNRAPHLGLKPLPLVLHIVLQRLQQRIIHIAAGPKLHVGLWGRFLGKDRARSPSIRR